MQDSEMPGKISGFLGKFQAFLPTDRKVRNTLQSFLENRLEIKEVLPKDSIRCVGKVLYIRTNPYIKQELLAHSNEILSLLRDKDHLYFERIQ